MDFKNVFFHTKNVPNTKLDKMRFILSDEP